MSTPGDSTPIDDALDVTAEIARIQAKLDALPRCEGNVVIALNRLVLEMSIRLRKVLLVNANPPIDTDVIDSVLDIFDDTTGDLLDALEERCLMH